MKKNPLFLVLFFLFLINFISAQCRGTFTCNILPAAEAKIVGSNVASLDELNREYYSVNVCPNPLKEEITLHYSLSNKSSVIIEIYDIAGKKIRNWQAPNQKPKGIYIQAISTTDLKSGVYFLKISIDKDETITKLVINA